MWSGFLLKAQKKSRLDNLMPFKIKRLIYACLSESGGVLDYAVYQVGALLKDASKRDGNDFQLHFICHKSFPVERLPAGIILHRFHAKRDHSEKRSFLSKVCRVFSMVVDLRSEARQVALLAEELAKDSSARDPLSVTRHNPRAAEVCVLFDCYKEYFAPFWIWPLRRLAKKGVVMGTIAHDPVRDFVVGPLRWHLWSVRLGYSFVRHVFVHDDAPVDFGGKRPEGIAVHQIPFGAYPLSPPRVGREEVRNRFGFVNSDIVFFAFGQIRDGKNLDLFLQAMTKLPENVKLLVAGKGHSGSSKPPEFYQNLSRELGVAERCRFEIRRVPDEEVGELFSAIDFTLLTYSAKFRSMSAVLATALTARKPVLASSGLGPLKSTVEKYQLGVFVKPDDPEETWRGASKLLPSSAAGKCEFELQPAWDKYEQENSWEENARRVCQAFES
jgi:glycosyltransferase involved in cell wall biosynthesis